MARRVEVIGCVSADGLVATSDMATDAADTQMHPILTDPQAFFAAVALGGHRTEHPEVRASHAPASSRRSYAVKRGKPPLDED